jgi:hypothetical protein
MDLQFSLLYLKWILTNSEIKKLAQDQPGNGSAQNSNPKLSLDLDLDLAQDKYLLEQTLCQDSGISILGQELDPS